MKTIQVVTDLKLAPDSSELVLVRETLEIQDGEFVVVGEKSESKIDLLRPRAKLKPQLNINKNMSAIISVIVQNSGFAPFVIEKISLQFHPGNTIDSNENQLLSNMAFQLSPVSTKESAMIFPGETRTYALIDSLADNMLFMTMKNRMTACDAVVFSAGAELARIEATHIVETARRIKASNQAKVSVNPTAKNAMESLSPESRESIIAKISELSKIPVPQWARQQNVTVVSGEDFFHVRFPDDILVFVFHKDGHVQIIDVIKNAPEQTKRDDDSK
ncbi:hypothetical protein [Zavarzinella formosa]|uniref:hypothetical protein n=1 Tax=Zavarzinella formosa TaxID=360055 RepID=UPI0002D61F82|nr:hypothetical protein [Zavarzinella formosa]